MAIKVNGWLPVYVRVCMLTGRMAWHRALLTLELLRHWVRCHQGEHTGPLYKELREKALGHTPSTPSPLWSMTQTHAHASVVLFVCTHILQWINTHKYSDSSIYSAPPSKHTQRLTPKTTEMDYSWAMALTIWLRENIERTLSTAGILLTVNNLICKH